MLVMQLLICSVTNSILSSIAITQSPVANEQEYGGELFTKTLSNL
jgi:hypothetical protein